MILPKQKGHLIILLTFIMFYQHCSTPNLTGYENYFIKFNVHFWFDNFYSGSSCNHCV